jgi:hypothetical protein
VRHTGVELGADAAPRGGGGGKAPTELSVAIATDARHGGAPHALMTVARASPVSGPSRTGEHHVSGCGRASTTCPTPRAGCLRLRWLLRGLPRAHRQGLAARRGGNHMWRRAGASGRG